MCREGYDLASHEIVLLLVPGERQRWPLEEGGQVERHQSIEDNNLVCGIGVD